MSNTTYIFCVIVSVVAFAVLICAANELYRIFGQ